MEERLTKQQEELKVGKLGPYDPPRPMTEMEAIGIVASDLKTLGEAHNKLTEQMRVLLQILENLNQEIEDLRKNAKSVC